MTAHFNDPTKDIRQIPLLQTPEHDCSYLDNERASTLFVDPKQTVDEDIYQQLIPMGFRRSGEHFYLPYCQQCSACIPVRIPVELFQPNRKQRRVLNVNSDLRCEIVPSIDNTECYALYERYIQTRHADGDMYPPSRDQFRDFLVTPHSYTEFFTYRLGNEVVCVSVVDALDDSLSAMYTFYDPEHDRRSLGTFAILQQIQAAQDRDIPHLYLGYWIKNCKKMRYKSEYRPIEMFLNGQWRTLN